MPSNLIAQGGSVTVSHSQTETKRFDFRHRHRRGNFKRASAKNFRAILPHRPRPFARDRRNGFGFGDRQTSRTASRRRSFRRFDISDRGTVFRSNFRAKNSSVFKLFRKCPNVRWSSTESFCINILARKVNSSRDRPGYQ